MEPGGAGGEVEGGAVSIAEADGAGEAGGALVALVDHGPFEPGVDQPVAEDDGFPLRADAHVEVDNGWAAGNVFDEEDDDVFEVDWVAGEPVG